MSDLDNEFKELRETNNELAQKVQYWKMTAAQRENEKLELMKEVTELRLKLSRLRSGSEAHAHKLDAALQTTIEEALSHIVQASNAVTRTLELVKTYMHDRQELDSALPRWSNISGSSSKKINKVRPMLIGGRSVQPFVMLDRTIQSNNNTSVSTNSHQNRVTTERAVPMHMLLDVYIPLRRIDAEDLPGNNDEEDMESNTNADNSTEALGLEERDDSISSEDSHMTDLDHEDSRRLEAVAEDIEPEDERETSQRNQMENPLEGPSWLLDRPTVDRSKPRRELDGFGHPNIDLRHPYRVSNGMNSREKSASRRSSHSTDERTPGQSRMSGQTGSVLREMTQMGSSSQMDGMGQSRSSSQMDGLGQSRSSGHMGGLRQAGNLAHLDSDVAVEFSPTVRRRRQALSPPPTPHSPRPSPRFSPRPMRRLSNNGRILKVLVAKMRLDDDEGGTGDSLPNRNTCDSRQWNRRVSLKRQSQSSPGGDIQDSQDNQDNQVIRDSRAQERLADVSPPKRTMRFDAPSPNGATDARVFIVETQPEACCSGQQKRNKSRNRRDRLDSCDSSSSAVGRDSDSSGEMIADSRPRRQKKAVIYKEKPLNRKLRR